MVKKTINEISNIELKRILRYEPEIVKGIFKHKYRHGQVDYGFVDIKGNYYAWFGADILSEVDPNNIDILYWIEIEM